MRCEEGIEAMKNDQPENTSYDVQRRYEEGGVLGEQDEAAGS